MSEYPECEKLADAKQYSQKIGEFLEWLAEQGVELAKRHKHNRGCYDEAEYDQDLEEDHMDAEGLPRYAERLCGYEGEDPLASCYENREKMLARFFEIDLNKVEEERRAMIATMREGN